MANGAMGIIIVNQSDNTLILIMTFKLGYPILPDILSHAWN